MRIAPVDELQPEQPKKRGRPRRYAQDGDRQKAWKQRSGFESSEERKAYKAAKAREYRKKRKAQGQESDA